MFVHHIYDSQFIARILMLLSLICIHVGFIGAICLFIDSCLLSPALEVLNCTRVPLVPCPALHVA
jgi:hypothetical protein